MGSAASASATPDPGGEQRRRPSISTRMHRVLASKFGLAADDDSEDSDDERERERARRQKRASVTQLRDERPPSGRSEESNADEKGQEKTLVLRDVVAKEAERKASLTADVLALMSRSRTGLAAKNVAQNLAAKKRAQTQQAQQVQPAQQVPQVPQVQQAKCTTPGAVAQDMGETPSNWGRSNEDDATSVASSEASSRCGQAAAAEAAREVEEAARRAAEEAEAADDRAADEQAAREEAECAAASAEQKAAALAAAEDALQQAEAALMQNDLAAARQQHTLGVKSLKAVGLNRTRDCEAAAALALILKRAEEMEKRWTDARMDGEAALVQAMAHFSARDFQRARQAVLRAQEAISRANPKEGAAALSERLGSLLAPLEDAEETEKVALTDLDAVLAQIEAKLNAHKAERNIEQARDLAADAGNLRLLSVELLGNSALGIGSAVAARQKQYQGLQQRIEGEKVEAEAREARRLLSIEENLCASFFTQALLFVQDGKIEEAEKFYQQALDAARTRLPADHEAQPMYQKAFDRVQELQGKGPKFEQARRLAEEQAAAATVAAAEEAAAEEAERLRKGAEAAAWKRDPNKRAEVQEAAEAKRKQVFAARARAKVRKAVNKIRMIRIMGGNPAAAVADCTALNHDRRRRQTPGLGPGLPEGQQDAVALATEEQEQRVEKERVQREEEDAVRKREAAKMAKAAAEAGMPVAPRLSPEELTRRVEDAKIRQRLLETAGQRGEFHAFHTFQRAGSGAKIAGRLQRVPSLADRDRDFLGGKELLEPCELAEELCDLVTQHRSYEGHAVEASSRHAAASDSANCLHMTLEREGPENQEALQEETAALQAEEAQRLALLDRALKMVDVSLGPHMVARKAALEDERRGAVAEYRKRVEAAERDVQEWWQGLEAQIKAVEAQIQSEYNEVYRFTELADATARQIDLVRRAKKAAEEREVAASETAEAQQRLVESELRKHALHCQAANQFQNERRTLQAKSLHAEAEAADERRRAQTCAHGSVDRKELENLVKETDEAAHDHGAGRGWNAVAPPGPKTLVRARTEQHVGVQDSAGVAVDDDGERTVVTTFSNKEGAERGVDIMREDLVAGDSELNVMAKGVLGSRREAGAAASVGGEAEGEGQDAGPVSTQDARKIVEAERERWRTMLPRPQLNGTASLASSPRATVVVTGAELDESQRVEPAATAATPVAATPKPSSNVLSTHMSMLSILSSRSMQTSASSARDSIARSICLTIRNDSDTISSHDGRAPVQWVRVVFDRNLQDGMRLGELALPAQSSEELQASACLRLMEARQAMGAMRKLARDVRRSGEHLLASANKRLEESSGDVLALAEAHCDAGRASALLKLSASVRLDGWFRAREAEKSAQASLRRAEELLVELVGPEAAAMVGVGSSRRILATGEQPLLPGAVANAQAKLELRADEGHGRFTSFLGIPLEVSLIVRSLLQLQAQREEEGEDPFTDERLLADRQLVSTGVRIAPEQFAKMRAEWQVEQQLENAIRRYMSGNLSREEYEKLVEAQGLSALPPSAVDSAIQLPVSHKGQQAPAPDPAGGLGGSWANICGRWHFIPPRTAAGITWKPSHFLQLAEADFAVMRKSSLYALVSVPPYMDGFGRNKKQHWSIVAEDAARLQEAESIQARVPAHIPASHGGSLPAGTRSSWQSALASPWKSSAKINGSSSVRVGCDAPQADYDPATDVLKAIDKLPHGDHLTVGDKAREPWNSASFALGTAGNKTHWAGAEVTQGRGYERGKATEEDVRRSVVFAIGEAFGLMPSSASTAVGQLRPPRQTAVGISEIKIDLSSMGLDDEYCFLITHALGHHPSGPVFTAAPADGSVKGLDEGDDLPERLLPHALSDETLRVTELRLSHNSIGDCGALELALALSDVPFTLFGANLRAGDEIGDGSGQTCGQAGMLREVRKLDVSCNIIGNVGATALSDMVSVNRSLSELSLSDNQIAGPGVEALSRALASNTHLETLDLSNNLLRGDDMGPLAAVLSWNAVLLHQLPVGAHVAVNLTLRCLLLKGNSLGDVGARLISAVLASHPTLEHVGLEDNGVGDEGADVLGHALQLRRSAGLPPLKYLSLAHNSVTGNGLEHFLSRLKAGRGGQAAGVHILDVLELKGNAGNAPSAASSLAHTLKNVGIGRVDV